MQDKELFKEFVNFCDSQPKDKVIDHSSWETCVVGEFFYTKGIAESEEEIDSNFNMSPELTSFIESLTGADLRSICRSYRWHDLFMAIGCINNVETYGEFTQFLKTYI